MERRDGVDEARDRGVPYDCYSDRSLHAHVDPRRAPIRPFSGRPPGRQPPGPPPGYPRGPPPRHPPGPPPSPPPGPLPRTHAPPNFVRAFPVSTRNGFDPSVPLPVALAPDAHHKNYHTLVDPRLPEGKGKELARRYESVPRTAASDPRRPGTRPRTSKRKTRKVVDRVVYKYDQYSVGPPPPREIVLSGLSPRTSPQAVLYQCRAFGAIESSELKVDPQTGESIGIMWVQFATATPAGTPQDGAEIAIKAQASLDGHKFGQETVKVVLDSARTKYVRTYRELLSKRYSGVRRRSLPARPPSRAEDAPTPPTPAARLPRRGGRAEEDDSPHRATTSRGVYASARPQTHDPVRITATHVRERLASLGHPYIFMPLSKSMLSVEAIRAHFASFAPALIESDHAGWYIGFTDGDTATRCKRVLEPTTLQGYKVRLDVLPAPLGDAPPPKPAPAPATPVKTSWTPQELVDEAEKQLLHALQSMFVRDVKNRTLAPLVTCLLAPDGAGSRLLAEHKVRTASKPTAAPPVLDAHLPSFRKKPEVVAAQHAPKPTKVVRREALDYSGDEEEEDAMHTVPLDPITLGVARDAEELYYLQQVLALDAAEAPIPDEDDAAPHASGCARAEGLYRIPAAEKAAHLPDRNRAAEIPATQGSSLASARNNRADSRRLVLDIEQHKRETMTDTDILKFNQLQSRKKQLRFSKSPIHDWGLYAMEMIPAGDMVIEYVGEIVRQQVADHREKMYERAGNFSTYLFRVDDDVVVDATHKGNIARLMNVRCTPAYPPSTAVRPTVRPKF